MDEPAVVVVETPPSEQMEVAQSEAAVEIAQIAAERDVAIAEINAATTETVVAAEQDANDEDVEWLRAELDGLRSSLAMHEAASSAHNGRISDLEAQVASLTETVTAQAAAITLLTPPPPLETLEPVSEPASEAARDNAGGNEADTGPARRKRVWLA